MVLGSYTSSADHNHRYDRYVIKEKAKGARFTYIRLYYDNVYDVIDCLLSVFFSLSQLVSVNSDPPLPGTYPTPQYPYDGGSERKSPNSAR